MLLLMEARMMMMSCCCCRFLLGRYQISYYNWIRTWNRAILLLRQWEQR